MRIGGGVSIFDKFSQDDVIMAFFPCTRFEQQILLSMRGQMHGMERWTYRQKMLNCMDLMSELDRNYKLVNKMFIVCMDRGLKLVMENPFSEEHFLRRYWCFSPAVIDKDRRKNGDYMKKPTQYWFLNFEPKRNLVFEPITMVAENSTDLVRNMTSADAKRIGARTIKQARSAISPQYANRFIRKYILDESEVTQ